MLRCTRLYMKLHVCLFDILYGSNFTNYVLQTYSYNSYLFDIFRFINATRVEHNSVENFQLYYIILQQIFIFGQLQIDMYRFLLRSVVKQDWYMLEGSLKNFTRLSFCKDALLDTPQIQPLLFITLHTSLLVVGL